MPTYNYKFNQLWGLELNTLSHFLVISSFVKVFTYKTKLACSPAVTQKLHPLCFVSNMCTDISL